MRVFIGAIFLALIFAHCSAAQAGSGEGNVYRINGHSVIIDGIGPVGTYQHIVVFIKDAGVVYKTPLYTDSGWSFRDVDVHNAGDYEPYKYHFLGIDYLEIVVIKDTTNRSGREKFFLGDSSGYEVTRYIVKGHHLVKIYGRHYKRMNCSYSCIPDDDK